MREKNDVLVNYYVRGEHRSQLRVDEYFEHDIPAKELVNDLRSRSFHNIQAFKITRIDRVERILL